MNNYRSIRVSGVLWEAQKAELKAEASNDCSEFGKGFPTLSG
jgi:hypothetical protein